MRLKAFGMAADIPIDDIEAMLSFVWGVRERINSVKSCKTPEEIELRSMECDSQFSLVDQLLVALKNGMKDLQSVVSCVGRAVHGCVG